MIFVYENEGLLSKADAEVSSIHFVVKTEVIEQSLMFW